MTSYSLTRAITLPLPRVVMAKWEIEVIFEPTGDYGGLLSNPSCPERILNEYSASTDVKLRSAVARNPNLSLSIFEVLSKDKSLKVKRSLSENLSCPINLLKKLSLDKSEVVKLGVRGNPLTPTEIIISLIEIA